MATTAAVLSWSRPATSHVGLVDETRRTYRHHGRQRGAPRHFPWRIATFHHATLRVAPHRYATREPPGHPGASRAFSADIPLADILKVQSSIPAVRSNSLSQK